MPGFRRTLGVSEHAKHNQKSHGRRGTGQFSSKDIDEAVSFAYTVVLSGGAKRGAELSPKAREFLKQTVTQDSYNLHRGLAFMTFRIEDAGDRKKLNALKVGDEFELGRLGDKFSSFSKKETVAKRYAKEGNLMMRFKATVPAKNVVVDFTNLQKVMKSHGKEKLFDSDDYAYFKRDKEVIVDGNTKAKVVFVSGKLKEWLEEHAKHDQKLHGRRKTLDTFDAVSDSFDGELKQSKKTKTGRDTDGFNLNPKSAKDIKFPSDKPADVSFGYAALYDPKTKSLTFAETTIPAHSELADAMMLDLVGKKVKDNKLMVDVRDEFLDRSVHLYAYGDTKGLKKIRANIEYSGVPVGFSAVTLEKDKAKGYKNIYKALDKLTSLGYTNTVEVEIKGRRGEKSVQTSLGEMWQALKEYFLNARELTSQEWTTAIFTEATVPWEDIFAKLSKEQRKIYRPHRYDSDLQEAMTIRLYRSRVETFMLEIADLLMKVGCGRFKPPQLTNQTIHDTFMLDSEQDAASITNTYNRELANLILRLGRSLGDDPKAKDYLPEIESWKRTREEFKASQVSMMTVNRTRHFAAREFFARNNKYLKQGTAILAGPKPAKEPICQGWFRRGRVPIPEAMKNPPPYHLNCPHYWRYNVRKIGLFRRKKICPLLWTGA